MTADAYPASSGDGYAGGSSTISALFEDKGSAEAAITELRQLGTLPNDISLISRDESEQMAGAPGTAGVNRESLGESDLTYTVSRELPNDEDLPTTEAQMTGEEISPDLDDNMVRRVDASADADIDIYTDFPDAPGGINPASPAASRAAQAANEQAPIEMGEERADSTIAGAGIGGATGLLVGITSLAVPGIGPVLAAGPLAGALSGLVAGGAAGGIIGALSTHGIPHEYARRYAASLTEGRTLVSVRTDSLGRDAIERVLVAHGGEDVVESG